MKFHVSRIDVLDIFLLLMNWQTYYLARNFHLYQLNKSMN